MSALESLVGSLTAAEEEEVVHKEEIEFLDDNCTPPLDDPGGTAFWLPTCTNSLLAAASDIGNHISGSSSSFNSTSNPRLHLVTQPTKDLKKLLMKAPGAGSSPFVFTPSPSRQSCQCPMCGKHIAQRRSLKQHLMSNFHKLDSSKADHIVKDYLSTITR